MSSKKNDTLHQIFTFTQDAPLQSTYTKEETELKQAYYEDEVKKLEGKFLNMSLQEKQDSEKVWASLCGILSFCNSASDYFLKIGFSDLALPYLEKARSFLDAITKEEIKNKKDWKIFKIQTMRNLSSYYNKKGDYKKAGQCLKKIYGLHTELEKEDIILPGFEFVYINLASFSMIEKNWNDTFKYATHAVNFLEKILKIKKGIPILENKPFSDDKDFVLVYSKKLVTLSRAYYMLAKSLMKKENIIDALTYLEKAYQIGAKYLGQNDKMTLSYQKTLDSALKKLKIQAPQPQDTSNPVVVANTSGTALQNYTVDMKLEVDTSKGPLRGFNLLNELMSASPSTAQLQSAVSYRDFTRIPQILNQERFLSPKARRPMSITSQISALMPLSTKNASVITQNIVESTLEKDDLIILDQNQKKGRTNTMLSSDLASNFISRNASYTKLVTPSLSMMKDNESKTRPKKPRTKASISFNQKDNDLQNKILSQENENIKNKASNLDIEEDFDNENTVKVTFRQDTLEETARPFALFMNQRPSSSKKEANQIAKYSLDSEDYFSLGQNKITGRVKPQKPPTVMSSRLSRTSIGKVSHRPSSAAANKQLSRFNPPLQQEYNNGFGLNINYRSHLKIKSPTKSKSKSKSPSKSRSFSPHFDPDHDLPGDQERVPDLLAEWESSIDTIKSGGQEENINDITLPKKKNKKISKGLMNILKTDAKNIKYGGEIIFPKIEDKGGFLNDPHKIEEKALGTEHSQNTNTEKIEEDKSPPKIDIVKNAPKILAKELLVMKAMKAIKDITHFRQLEEEAARKIQIAFRRVRKLTKLSSINANADDQNILSSNELNSMQNAHAKPGESLLEANFDNYYPSHNNLETQSSQKLSKILRKSIIFKNLNDLENNKINVEYLYRSRDEHAWDCIQKQKMKKEEEEEFVGNKSLIADNKFMMPKAEEDLSPKIEIIKRNIKNLKDYEISFYGYFFGASGLWSIRYGGIREKKDNLFLVFYLCHGTINHPISVRADLTVTEKAMFYSTIWKVISANLNGYLTKEEMHFHLKPKINNKEERMFLIIKDLKKEEKLNPLLRITKFELESLREMLIKLCFILETKFIVYRKATGYVYEWAKRVENAQTATRNRQYLVLSKGKLQKQIRKLATQYNPFLYTLDKFSYFSKLLSQLDIHRTLSGGSVRKSFGILPVGSETEREEEPAPIIRTSTVQTKEVSEFIKTRHKRKGTKKNTNFPKLLNQFKAETLLINSETLPKSEEIQSKVIEQYKNPFVFGQILFQSLIHIDKHYLLASLKILFSKVAADEVTDETQLEFLVETELLGGNRWRDQIRLPYKDFMDKIKHIKIPLKEFMINSGFLAKQRRLLSEFFLRCIVIVESKLHIRNIQYEAKSQIKSGDDSLLINQRRKYLELGKPKNVDEFFQKLLKVQNFWKDEPIEEQPLEQIGLPSVKVVGEHEPNFGASENIDYRQQLGNPEIRMEYYNSLKYLKPRRYYILFQQARTQIMLRMDYVDNGVESYMHIALYHHCTGTIDFINIKEKKLQERLLNVMQMSSNEMRKKSLTEIFEFQKSLTGNKLLLNEKLKLERYNKKFDITPTNISQILMTHGDENLPKYRLDIQKHFTKGVINNLGNCYITITTYFINNLYKFDNIYCIKFEILPFTSKTKFYKFIINSKDLKLYLNKDYPLENPYKNWDTLHFIIQSLVLKRQYVYSTIELPITDTKFMLMKYQRYNLKNIVSQSIEFSSIGAQVIFGNFLQPKIQETQVILQITKKINGHYVIITIEKHTILDHWSIIVYDPKTCRKYVTSIYFSDITALDPNFTEMLYSTSAMKLENDKRVKTDYSRFTKSYMEATGGSYTSLSKQQKKPVKPKDNLSSLILDDKSKILLKENKDKENENRKGKNSKQTEQEKKNFYEIKFWENMVKYFEFSYTKSGNILLVLNTFRGVLREFIHREVVQTSASEESLVEVFLENSYKKYSMFQTIHHISLPYVQNHDLFVRVTRLEKMTIYNNRFNLKQVIELYQKENLRDQVNLIKNNKIVFSQIKMLSQYMTFKVKMWNMVTISENELNKKQSINKENILPWMNYKLKLNCNFETIAKIDHQHLFVDQQLIFRGMLTVMPLQIVSLVYDEKNGFVTAYLYDVKESWLLKKTIRMRDIVVNIPYVKVMLKQKLNYEVGKRIYEALKNSLIVYSFMKKKKIV